MRFLLFLKIVLNTRAVFSKVHKSYSVRNAFSVFFCNRSEYERCLFKFSRIVLSTKAVFYVFQNRSEYEMLFQKSKSYWKRILPPKFLYSPKLTPRDFASRTSSPRTSTVLSFPATSQRGTAVIFPFTIAAITPALPVRI